jgi:hypothetical protein
MNDPWLVLAAGTGFIAIGIWELTSSNDLHRRGVRTLGTVTGFREEMSGDDKMYYPIIHFRDRDGAEQTVRYPSGSNVKFYQLGQQVTVIYLPEEPEYAKLDEPLEFTLVPWVCFALGTMCVGLSLWEFLQG